MKKNQDITRKQQNHQGSKENKYRLPTTTAASVLDVAAAFVASTTENTALERLVATYKRTGTLKYISLAGYSLQSC